MTFNVKIDKKTTKQELLNIEDRTRTSIFAWNGQFSPQFIETMLKQFGKDRIYDPFMGCGTVLGEACRLNYSAFGIELNAAPFHMANIYKLSNLSIKDRQKKLQQLDKTITTLDDIKDSSDDIIKCLIILLDLYNNNYSDELLREKWKKLKELILELPYSKSVIKTKMGDSRNSGFKENSADFLITSPPYINVFNYHQKYRKSVEQLGYNVLEIAKSEIGSNRKNRGNRLLTVIEYCNDLALSMNDSSKVCTDGSRMIYVVGRESTVLGYHFCNSEIIYKLGILLGWKFELRQERLFKNRFGQLIYEDILHFTNKKNTLSIDEILSGARKIAKATLTSKLKELNTNNTLLKDAIEKIDSIKVSGVKK